jgi:hypothetical protein
MHAQHFFGENPEPRIDIRKRRELLPGFLAKRLSAHAERTKRRRAPLARAKQKEQRPLTRTQQKE